jgi:uncharacterized protein YjiS (DUF1127 family)
MLWPSVAVLKALLDEVFEDIGISSALEYST